MLQVFSNQRDYRVRRTTSSTDVLAILIPVCFGLVAHSFLSVLIQLFDRLLVISKDVNLVFFGKLDVLTEEIHREVACLGSKTEYFVQELFLECFGETLALC